MALSAIGGILGYFEQVGGDGYYGGRIHIERPQALRPEKTTLLDCTAKPQVMVSVG